MDAEYREFEAGDSGAVCELLNGVFGPIAADDWQAWVKSDFTAAIALVDGHPAGAIPLHRRTFRVAPGADIVVWIQHRVGVSKACRGLKLGAGMQKNIREFLPGRGDAMMVISTSENAGPYQFYLKSGFYPMLHPRKLLVEPAGQAAPASVTWMPKEQFVGQGKLWLDLFQACYGNRGGYAVRSLSFWKELLNSLVWRDSAAQSVVCGVCRQNDRIAGYMVLSKTAKGLAVIEMAVRPDCDSAGQQLLAAARGLGLPVSATTNRNTALWQWMCAAGAAVPPRPGNGNAIVFSVVDIESMAAKVWRAPDALRNVELRVWTPMRQGSLHHPVAPERVVTLQMEESTLTQLLLRRLNLAPALEEERVTILGETPGDAEALNEAWAPATWAFQSIEGL